MIKIKEYFKNLFKKKPTKRELELLEHWNKGRYLMIDGKTNNKELLDKLLGRV